MLVGPRPANPPPSLQHHYSAAADGDHLAHHLILIIPDVGLTIAPSLIAFMQRHGEVGEVCDYRPTNHDPTEVAWGILGFVTSPAWGYGRVTIIASSPALGLVNALLPGLTAACRIAKINLILIDAGNETPSTVSDWQASSPQRHHLVEIDSTDVQTCETAVEAALRRFARADSEE